GARARQRRSRLRGAVTGPSRLTGRSSSRSTATAPRKTATRLCSRRTATAARGESPPTGASSSFFLTTVAGPSRSPGDMRRRRATAHGSCRTALRLPDGRSLTADSYAQIAFRGPGYPTESDEPYKRTIDASSIYFAPFSFDVLMDRGWPAPACETRPGPQRSAFVVVATVCPRDGAPDARHKQRETAWRSARR